MWNFTARGLLIPNVDNIEELFKCKETVTQSQHDTLLLEAEDITLEKNKKHLRIWNTHKDNYLIQLLKDGLGFESKESLKEMSDYGIKCFLVC